VHGGNSRGRAVASCVNWRGQDDPCRKLICENLPAEGVPAVVKKAPTAIGIDLEDEGEEVPSVAQNEKGATQREKATKTKLDNRTDAVAVREQRVHTRAQMRAAEEVEVLEEVNLIEDTEGTKSIMTEKRVSKGEQKAPDRYGGSEKNAWITPAKKKTTRIEKG
jgi:hypothetical protein